jgi:hypothetical protein
MVMRSRFPVRRLMVALLPKARFTDTCFGSAMGRGTTSDA